MLIEYVTKANSEKLKQLGYSYEAGCSRPNTAVYGHVDERVEESISSTLNDLRDALPDNILRKNSGHRFDDKAIGKKGGVAAKKSNRPFFCVEYPESGVMTPGEFLDNPKFQNLDGAIKIGSGIIRIKDGQYYNMKGALQITFKIDDGEKIEMVLLSESASGFGEIMVHIDDKNCEVFSKYCEELKKEPRISKVVEAAESFIQKNKAVSSPLSSMEDTETSSHLENIGQSTSKSVMH